MLLVERSPRQKRDDQIEVVEVKRWPGGEGKK